MDKNNAKQVLVDELHKPTRKNFPRCHVIQKGINDTVQIDLVEMIPYSRVNKGNKYLLTAIDIFSKKGYARAVHRKTGANVTKAMESILEEIKSPPKNIHSDQGKEFYNSHFQKLMKTRGINHYHTFTELKASIVERFNRTLKTQMWKLFALNGNHVWIRFIDDLIKKYNNTYHRTIRMKPNQVSYQNEKDILHSVYKYPSVYRGGEKFAVGDKVRISKYKGIFSKGYKSSWSTEVFTVKKIRRTSPFTYILEDDDGTTISGGFYEKELQRTKTPSMYIVEKILKRNNEKCYVKWLGFDSTYNSWINKKDLI